MINKYVGQDVFTLIELIDHKDKQICEMDKQIVVLTEKLKTRQEIIDKTWEDVQ